MLGRIYLWAAALVRKQYRKEVDRLNRELAVRQAKVDELRREFADAAVSVYLKTNRLRNWDDPKHEPDAEFTKLKVEILIAHMPREAWIKHCAWMREKFGANVELGA